ncbi:hypothetical protein NIES4106_62380 (plasmid) [Fischerella sp. NIES-4106]|nr:hypothetical protein NIES4106_62380 [Fischerella sp. NIES-4106]
MSDLHDKLNTAEIIAKSSLQEYRLIKEILQARNQAILDIYRKSKQELIEALQRMTEDKNE